MAKEKKFCSSDFKIFPLILGLILNILVIIVAIMIYHNLIFPKACVTNFPSAKNIEQPPNNEIPLPK